MQPSSIDFCIPYVSSGLACIEFLIKNALETAFYPDRIRFIVSYHSESDLAHLKSSQCYKNIFKVIYSEPYSKKVIFYPSANHSLAINNLSKETEGDIVIFCDYDMAFVKKGWDCIIENDILSADNDIVGVTYQPFLFKINNGLTKSIPWLKFADLLKYQDLPNLSFFCLKRDVLIEKFNGRMTFFEDFLSSGGLPFRIINTAHMSIVNNLPFGSVQWLDTGYEIPQIIYDKKIKYKTLAPIDFSKQKILDYISNPSELNPLLLPEIFSIDSINPFLCHFKKGTTKMGENEGHVEFQKFKICIENFNNN